MRPSPSKTKNFIPPCLAVQHAGVYFEKRTPRSHSSLAVKHRQFPFCKNLPTSSRGSGNEMNESSAFSEEKKDECESSSNDDVKTMEPNAPYLARLPDESVIMSEEKIASLSHISQMYHTKIPSNEEDVRQPHFVLRFIRLILRVAIFDFPLTMLFLAVVTVTILHMVHDKYLARQLEMMTFHVTDRPYHEYTYYERDCNLDEEISATSREELILPKNTTAEECVAHQMKHGVSVYQDLLTPETMHELREFIVQENPRQKGWYVIQNENRYSWGIDVNMHPAIKKYWKELGSNELLVRGIHAIVGPDPAIIEFTAITAAYGAKDQGDHQDVIAPGNGIKYAHSYVPSYSLFIPLQDTTYDMGATHVCPGTHLCGDGVADQCPNHNIAMSGEADLWPKGWGALVNQQTFHKGMGHSKEGGLDRVVIICTFAPRPQTFRGLETRLIGHGGSYSIEWSSWGHTFSDFVNADERMWEPLKTMRALGLVKGHGWNVIHTASMRIANDDNGYRKSDLEDFVENGGFKFLPTKWQGALPKNNKESDPNLAKIDHVWYDFLIGTLKRTENGLRQLYVVTVSSVAVLWLIWDFIRFAWCDRSRHSSAFLGGLVRIFLLNSMVVILGFIVMGIIDESNWAKDIAAGRSYRLPPQRNVTQDSYADAVLPTQSDVLIAPEYAAEHLGGYGHVLDYAHPGNVKWNEALRLHGSAYRAFSSDLQLKFCQSLLDSFQTESRFLKQNQDRTYVSIEDRNELYDICHRDLIASTDKKVFEMMRGLNSLKTTAALGRFANTAMQSTHSPLHLKSWEKVFVPRRSWKVKSDSTNSVRAFHIRGGLTSKSGSRSKGVRSLGSSILGPRESVEPYPLAWVREGDVVEALPKCSGAYFYRARVVGILPPEANFDLVFDDGEENSDISVRCLRPFEPFRLDEEVQVREIEEDEDTWYEATIIRISHNADGNPVCDVKFPDTDDLLTDIESHNIRRIISLKEGESISARFGDGDEWFSGIILQSNSDGSYSIEYDDGDVEENVPIGRIRINRRR